MARRTRESFRSWESVMKENVRIENLKDSNIEDLISVCSFKRLNDPTHQRGVDLKRRWLLEMLVKYGSIAKVAYLEDKPVAQILFYPEESDMTNASPRKNVLIIMCVYNPTPLAQKRGIGIKLLQSLVLDAKRRTTCLGNRGCKFILVKAFNAGELLPMPNFFIKNGFFPTPEREGWFYFPIEGHYEPARGLKEYEPLSEDRGKTVILYGPTCQFSYQFAKKMEEQIREVAPNVPIELVNEWEKPEESIKRRNNVLTVNARPIKTFFMDTVRFKEEVRFALN